MSKEFAKDEINEIDTSGLKRNPRAKVPEEKWCQFVYPEDHPTRAGERCQAVSMKGSKFCYYHMPNQSKLLEQLQDARDARENPPNVKHGFYSNKERKCDECNLQDACEFYEKGKNVCDFVLKQDIDLSSLKNIQKNIEEIMQSELGTYRLLSVIVEKYPDNAELVDLKRKYGNTIVRTLKDFASIKQTYEKTAGAKTFKEALLE